MAVKRKTSGGRGGLETKVPRKVASARAARAASVGPIDVYLAAIGSAPARATLTCLRKQLRALLPSATEVISYGMPGFRLPSGDVVAGFAFSGKNCGYYPHSSEVLPKLAELLEGYKTTKGALSFPPEVSLPKELVSALVRARLAEINEGQRGPKPRRIAPAGPARKKTRRATSPGEIAPKEPRVFGMSFASVYVLYVEKAEKKGRTRQEVDEVIAWLTGYRGRTLQRALDDKISLKAFLANAPRWNPRAELISGVVCGVRVEEVPDPWMKKIRYLDKLVDELARGKKMESILRK